MDFLAQHLAPFQITHRNVMDLLDQAAQRFVLPRHGALGDADIQEKSSPTDLVTIADIEAEAWLSVQLQALLPQSLILGEEAQSRDPELMKVVKTAQILWILDPVDGTNNFARGSLKFCMMLALCVHGEPLASWILAPLQNKIYCAQQGLGAYSFDYKADASSQEQRFTNQCRLKSLPSKDYKGFISVKYFPQEQRERLKGNYLAAIRQNQTYGCAGIEYASIASTAIGLILPYSSQIVPL